MYAWSDCIVWMCVKLLYVRVCVKLLCVCLLSLCVCVKLSTQRCGEKGPSACKRTAAPYPNLGGSMAWDDGALCHRDMRIRSRCGDILQSRFTTRQTIVSLSSSIKANQGCVLNTRSHDVSHSPSSSSTRLWCFFSRRCFPKDLLWQSPLSKRWCALHTSADQSNVLHSFGRSRKFCELFLHACE